MVTRNTMVEDQRTDNDPDASIGGIILAYVLGFELVVGIALGVARFGLHLY